VEESGFCGGLIVWGKNGTGELLEELSEQIVPEVRKKTLLPLDDLLMVSKPIYVN